MSNLKKYGFLLAYSVPALWLSGIFLGGWWHYLSPIFIFVVVPFLDYLVGEDEQNISDENVAYLSKQGFFRWITFLWVPVQLGILIFAFYQVSFHSFDFKFLPGFVLGLGLITGGIGITVAHELGHKNNPFERFLSKLLLITVCYGHFYIEHNRGHHVRVATPEDPATSRKGEGFYAFWLRSVFGSWLSAWGLEKNRLKKLGKSAWSLGNQMLWLSFLPFLFVGGFFLMFSFLANRWVWEVPTLFFVQSIIAFSLLEQVNYIEHYGMVRQQKENGSYERVNPTHSWNANHLISNLFLFHLQRHSDHHTFAAKRYQVLKHYDESPQLPSGYPAMILLCLLPPFWFQIMDSRLDVWKSKQMVG